MVFENQPQFPDSARFPSSSASKHAALKHENPLLSMPADPTPESTENRPENGKKVQANGRSIHLASANSSAAYLPIQAHSGRGKRENLDEVFTKLQRFLVGAPGVKKHTDANPISSSGLAIASELPRFAQKDPQPYLAPNGAAETAMEPSQGEHSPAANSDIQVQNPEEIPEFTLADLEYKDPISLVEGLAKKGQKYGAIKIKTNGPNTEKACSLNPDTFTLKANRLLNNPSRNELFHRLKFYNELIKFHTREMKENGSRTQSPQVKDDNLNIALDSKSPSATPGVNTPEIKEESTEENNQKTPDIPPEPKQERSASEEDATKAAPKSKIPVFLTKFPMMDKKPLDLFDLFRFVVRKGGYAEVINRKLWAQVGRELGYKGKITSSLSSSLKMSYAKILYPLEIHLGPAAVGLTGDESIEYGKIEKNEKNGSQAEEMSDPSISANVGISPINDQKAPKREAENTEAVVKKRKLNNTAPLILGSAPEFHRSTRLKASKGFLLNEAHLLDLKTPLVIATGEQTEKKSELLVSPTGAPAQINNYLKWLACLSSVIQDSTRLDVSSKLATTCSLRQFLEKDSKFQEFLLRNYGAFFSVDVVAKDGKVCMHPSRLEQLFWQYLSDAPTEYRRLENCPKIPANFGDGFHHIGADFSLKKAQVYAGSNRPSGTALAGETERNSGTDGISGAVSVISGALNAFEVANLPFLPDSLLGAYTASDLCSDLASPSLNVGMTFSTENWRCEDHFTQLCSYHSVGKSKRWYFIPESEFEKFETLLSETVSRQNRENPRVNKNYDRSCWDVAALEQFITTDDEVTSTQYECLYNSLENIVSPFPEMRMEHDNPVFQRLIELTKKNVTMNQEYLITPAMLRERGIRYTTTLQKPGEIIYKYPKTYSATISLGFSVCEEINFASKLWLDYATEGERWLQKQGILPSMSTFKLLTNFAQLLESANASNNSFSPEVHSKVSDTYSVLLEEELTLRYMVRKRVKVKEITIEERNIPESDVVTDDDLSSAIPSKVVIYSSASSFSMSLSNFGRYISEESADVTHIDEDLTFAELLKHSKFQVELHLFYSDEKLRSFQRSLRGFSVDYEAWMAKYDELMDSEDEMVLKNYKALLHDGQKIYSALSGAQNTFERFCSGKKLNPETQTQMEQITVFKKQVENLREFVEESSSVVEQCHAILSLKHQQRIRNGGAESETNEEEHPESLQMLVELANKIPYLNFHTPEFELVMEYKSEIQNFDKACRSLIESGAAGIPDIDDMINLGTSFGIQIPSLKFLVRLKSRLQWMETHDIIVSGGDPFSGKKEIFSLPDLRRFRDKGMEVLSSGDVGKLKTIDQYLEDGQKYDEAIRSYLSQNKSLNGVDVREIDAKILDMEERSKMKGPERLFVKLTTYQKLVDLKAQEKHITFLRDFSQNTHGLHDIRQLLSELANCTYAFDDSHVKEKVEQSEQWLKKAEYILEEVKVLQRQNTAQATTKNTCSSRLVEKLKLVAEKTRTGFEDEKTDVFECSSPYLFRHNLQDDYVEQTPIRYCLCREFEDGTMIECDVCHEWFHITCVKSISKIGGDDDSYVCPCCSVLSAYQATSETPKFTDKLQDATLLELIQEGESLQVKPETELGLLRELWGTIVDAQKWFSKPEMRTRIATHGTLYQMFLLRKFVGSPVYIGSIVVFLLSSLKPSDIARAFDSQVEPQAEKMAEIADTGRTESEQEFEAQQSGAIQDTETEVEVNSEPGRELRATECSAPTEPELNSAVSEVSVSEPKTTESHEKFQESSSEISRGNLMRSSMDGTAKDASNIEGNGGIALEEDMPVSTSGTTAIDNDSQKEANSLGNGAAFEMPFEGKTQGIQEISHTPVSSEPVDGTAKAPVEEASYSAESQSVTKSEHLSPDTVGS